MSNGEKARSPTDPFKREGSRYSDVPVQPGDEFSLSACRMQRYWLFTRANESFNIKHVASRAHLHSIRVDPVQLYILEIDYSAGATDIIYARVYVHARARRHTPLDNIN